MKSLSVSLLFIIVFMTNLFDADLRNKNKIDSSETITSRLLSAAFIGHDSVWLVTQVGRDLFFTKSEGVEWNVVPSNTINGFGQVTFIDEAQGWAFGSTGNVWKTSDGGHHWEMIAKLKPHNQSGFVGIQAKFIDELHGWIIEPSHFLWRTIDGGRTWKVSSTLSEKYMPDLIRFSFVNPRVGWLACNNGIVLKTNDGGSTWDVLKTGLTLSVHDIYFIDEKIGWALIGSRIYHTTNSGKSWQLQFGPELPFESPTILSLFFLDNKTGWAVGHTNPWAGGVKTPSKTKGVILRTTDGGNTWDTEVKEYTSVFSQIYFADMNHGWLISPDHIYRTEDGGQDWKAALKIPVTSR